jgi:hypothetical protein
MNSGELSTNQQRIAANYFCVFYLFDLMHSGKENEITSMTPFDDINTTIAYLWFQNDPVLSPAFFLKIEQLANAPESYINAYYSDKNLQHISENLTSNDEDTLQAEIIMLSKLKTLFEQNLNEDNYEEYENILDNIFMKKEVSETVRLVNELSGESKTVMWQLLQNYSQNLLDTYNNSLPSLITGINKATNTTESTVLQRKLRWYTSLKFGEPSALAKELTLGNSKELLQAIQRFYYYRKAPDLHKAYSTNEYPLNVSGVSSVFNNYYDKVKKKSYVPCNQWNWRVDNVKKARRKLPTLLGNGEKKNIYYHSGVKHKQLISAKKIFPVGRKTNIEMKDARYYVAYSKDKYSYSGKYFTTTGAELARGYPGRFTFILIDLKTGRTSTKTVIKYPPKRVTTTFGAKVYATLGKSEFNSLKKWVRSRAKK